MTKLFDADWSFEHLTIDRVKTNISPRIPIDIRGEIFVLTQISINLIKYIYSNFHEPYLGTIDNVALDLLPSKCRHL